MSHSVLLDPRAAKSLGGLNPTLRERIKVVLGELRESPETKGDRLHPSDYSKVRIGDYRAIYQIDRKAKRVIVLFLGHRSKVYDDFERMI